MQRATLKAWFLVHKWTSLACTLFLLLLCVTGLPLVFYEEINHLTGAEPEAAAPPPGARPANLDVLVARALAQHPGDVPLFLGWDDHAPTVYVNTGARPDVPPAQMNTVIMHAYSGEILPAPQFNEGVMWIIFRLHTDVFVGLAGTLFLGAMALLFAASVVSGLVIYGPFMRKLPFGAVRTGRSARLKWLDLHNLLGVVTLGWALVVGVTGAINTLATPLQQSWQANELAALTAPYQGKPRPDGNYASIDQAVADARRAAPGMTPAYVSYPGVGYSGDHHYGVFVHGATPLGERLTRPVLVDVQSGDVTATPDLPWHLKTLLLSQPLHFGDYGGLPLKIVWALLDLVTIVVLGSGLYLWLARARTSDDVRVAEIQQGGLPVVARDPA
ncbi:MAG: PepSY-associated TM helix domain-containing protein [Phenylobacterium sp.]